MFRTIGLPLVFAAFMACCRPAFAGWVAFIAPDIPQTRALFAELQRRAAQDLSGNGLELRFVTFDDGTDDEGRRLLARVVGEQPRLIFATSARTAIWAKEATASIPIVFASVADPIRSGLVRSLARPGGNATGFTYDIPVEGKQLELLRELVPGSKRLGVLDDGTWLGERMTPDQLSQYERVFGVSIQVFRAGDAEAMVRTVQGTDGRRVDGWLVPISNTAAQGRKQIIEALRRARRPAVFGRSFFVDDGGLAAFQEAIDAPMEIWHDILRQILGGIPPTDIPVQRPRRFELTINLATAKALGLVVPAGLLRRADRVVTK